jgi:hypothetical protein
MSRAGSREKKERRKLETVSADNSFEDFFL